MNRFNINQRSETHIYRKRDNQGNLIENVMVKDVFVPFKVSVPAGTSTFNVPVPKTYMNHEFSFDNLMLIPDMYEEQAAVFDEETEEELEEFLMYPVAFKITYDSRTKFYGPDFIGKTETRATKSLIKNINTHFEFTKPTGIVHTGVFFDWYDYRFKDVPNLDDFVQKMALAYYGEIYDPVKHYNALPVSARSVAGANNYVIPTIWSEENVVNIRMRINLAPNTYASFSTNKHLNCIGFTDAQLGPANSKTRNYEFSNYNNAGYANFLAEKPLIPFLTDGAKSFKMFLQMRNFNYTSDSHIATLTKKNALKNENYQTAIQNTFNDLKNDCNIELFITYNVKNRQFSFIFPPNLNMLLFRIDIPPNLKERLGFQMFKDITPTNFIGQKIDIFDPKETEERARALAHDTGLIIVSDFNTGTNTTCGIGELYMAALYPTETGTMVMHMNELCNEQPTVNFPAINMSTQMITATFLLSKFIEDNNLVDLIWKEGFKMQGTLRGVHPLKQKN